MQGIATLHHHPIHAALIPFPLSFWIGSGGADAIFEVTQDPFWNRAAKHLMEVGVATGLASAAFGLADYLTIPMSSSAKRTATVHLLANVGLVGLYAANRRARTSTPGKRNLAGYALSAVGLAGLVYSGWLGGTLSFEHHIGVEEPAHGTAEGPARPRRAA